MAKASSTTLQNVVVPPEVWDQIETHSYSNLQAEVGGMLVGSVSGRTTTIVGFIPALNASAEQISLTFTHEVWAEILKKVDADFPGETIVGWYHTHPGFGIFLSEYDSFIQENFFNNPGQLALVVDPVAGLRGWFQLNASKKIVQHPVTPTSRGPREKRHMVVKSSGDLRFRTVIALVVGASLVTGAAVWGAMKLFSPPDTAQALMETRSALVENQELLNRVLANPTLVLAVSEGDTLDSVATRFYADASYASYVAQINGLSVDSPLTPGQILVLPSVPRISAIPEIFPQPVTETETTSEPTPAEPVSTSPVPQN
jgi:proteasome lid subunit RPN8/RPN11